MGVPGFFLWLMKNYKKDGFIFKKDDQKFKSEIENIDYFLIDANCLIHPVCFRIIAENPELYDNERLEDKMIVAVLEYFEKIIAYVNPVKGTFIAIDGVAPIAKIKQQRSRRFKSVADKIMQDNLKKKYSKPITSHWNNNAITPGTIFMGKLHKRITSWAKDKQIIYSSYLTPAEGEHKLLQYIRDNKKKDLKYVIYGLDADLIFLALSTESDKIFLLREATEFNKKESKEVLNFVSIRVMRDSIYSTMKRFIDNVDSIKIINDFIFMCYFLGNDFLPHIPSLDIQNEGIENLIKNYTKTATSLPGEYLLEDKINNKFLASFIKNLASEEEYILKSEFGKPKRRFFCDGDDYAKEISKIENLQFKVIDPIKLGSDTSEKWRLRYYKHYWNINDDELEDFSEKLVKNYLMGIKWVTEYYFVSCPCWDWYYPFDHPPFISDIAKFIDKIDMNDIKFKLGKPLEPFMQLLSVLPPQSSFLLPTNLQKLVINPKSSIIYMYPNEFTQDFINKKRYWMGIPNLPPLDIEQLKHYYNKYKNELSKEELERNIIS
jgi:5'-3' exoribonuclease 2